MQQCFPHIISWQRIYTPWIQRSSCHAPSLGWTTGLSPCRMAPGEWACEEAGRRDVLSKTGLMGLWPLILQQTKTLTPWQSLSLVTHKQRQDIEITRTKAWPPAPRPSRQRSRSCDLNEDTSTGTHSTAPKLPADSDTLRMTTRFPGIRPLA